MLPRFFENRKQYFPSVLKKGETCKSFFALNERVSPFSSGSVSK